MINNCQQITYEAGRDAAESIPRAKRACLVQILVQMAHVIFHTTFGFPI